MISVTLHKKFSFPSHWRYGIVRHNINNADSGGTLGSILPDIARVQDRPIGESQGASIRIIPSWWKYIQKLNPDPRDFGYTTSIDVMWINIIWPQNITAQSWGSLAQAERVTNGGNFVLIDRQTNSHFHLVSMSPYLNTDHLDIKYSNWHVTPWLFFKACAIRSDGRIFNVGQAQDVYFPFLRGQYLDRTEQPDNWLPQSRVELFPELPYYLSSTTSIVEYLPQGCSVLGRTNHDEWIYLLRSRFAGERIFETSWGLSTFGVVPPAQMYDYEYA